MEKNSRRYRSPLEQTGKARKIRMEEFFPFFFLRGKKEYWDEKGDESIEAMPTRQRSSVNSLGTEIHTIETKHSNIPLLIYLLLPLHIPKSST